MRVPHRERGARVDEGIAVPGALGAVPGVVRGPVHAVHRRRRAEARQPGGPPIWIGGGRSRAPRAARRRRLDRVPVTPERFRASLEKIEALPARSAAARLRGGFEPAHVLFTVVDEDPESARRRRALARAPVPPAVRRPRAEVLPARPPAACVERLAEFVAAGVRTFVIYFTVPARARAGAARALRAEVLPTCRPGGPTRPRRMADLTGGELVARVLAREGVRRHLHALRRPHPADLRRLPPPRHPVDRRAPRAGGGARRGRVGAPHPRARRRRRRAGPRRHRRRDRRGERPRRAEPAPPDRGRLAARAQGPGRPPGDGPGLAPAAHHEGRLGGAGASPHPGVPRARGRRGAVGSAGPRLRRDRGRPPHVDGRRAGRAPAGSRAARPAGARRRTRSTGWRRSWPRAERPAIVAGSGVYWDGAWDALAGLAERAGLPVFTNGMGRGCLPHDHPMAFQLARGLALREADVVLVLGHPARLPARLRPGAGVRGRGAGRDGRRGGGRLRPEPHARRGPRGGRPPDPRGAGGGRPGGARGAERGLAPATPRQGGRRAREAGRARRVGPDAHHPLPAGGRAGGGHERAHLPGRGRGRRGDLRLEDRAALAPRPVARSGAARRSRGRPALRAGGEGAPSRVARPAPVGGRRLRAERHGARDRGPLRPPAGLRRRQRRRVGDDPVGPAELLRARADRRDVAAVHPLRPASSRRWAARARRSRTRAASARRSSAPSDPGGSRA